MRIFRAIGFIILLITLRVLLPQVFEALNTALVSFFHAFTRVAEYIDPTAMDATSFEAIAPKIPSY